MKPGTGVKGFLLRTFAHGDERLVFRVYDPDDKKKYIDYQIRHHDPQVVIDDKSVVLVQDGEKTGYLDYHPDKLKPARRIKRENKRENKRVRDQGGNRANPEAD